MPHPSAAPTPLGHPISIEEMPYEHVFAPPLRPCGDHLDDTSPIERLYTNKLSALVIRGALTRDRLESPLRELAREDRVWASPNRGMPGGELRTLGAAATPTLTALGGPEREAYLKSAHELDELNREIFSELDITTHLGEIFSELFEGCPAAPPLYVGSETLSSGRSGADDHPQRSWLPFNYRALDEGVQIYSHHDAHYRLPIYEGLSPEYDRSSILSWFMTLQRPASGGRLTLYGLWGSDPNPPMLPSRFIDTEALERSYRKLEVELDAGDLVIFDSGRYVHRVTSVEGPQARITLGGFMTPTLDRTRLGFWS